MPNTSNNVNIAFQESITFPCRKPQSSPINLRKIFVLFKENLQNAITEHKQREIWRERHGCDKCGGTR